MAAPIECRLLGPLEVLVDGRQVRLGGVRPRLLFVTLLLAAGSPVRVQHLVDAVWGDQPPSSSRSQVSIHVSALRRAFATVGRDDVIETVPDGYRMRDDITVDAQVAEQRVDEARAAAAAGRHADAAEQYAAALALWRGQVLGGLDSVAITPFGTRLEELRLTAVAERAELELALGRHHELTHELAPVVAEHPFRERLRGQLMLALGRAGRTAEALAVYRDGRRLLVDELGLEPGPELRRLEQAVLDGDLAPPVHDVPDIAGSRRVPAELPGDLATFTGRAEEVRAVAALVGADGHRTVAIAGPGGIGKSAFAVHVAHEVAHRYPDGQLYVDLRGSTPDAKPLEPGEVLAEFLRSLGVATSDLPAAEEAAARTFRDLTRGRRLLVVLDNAATAEQVHPLLPDDDGCAVLVTSRRRLASLDRATHRELGVLSTDEGLEVLARVAGQDRVDAEPDDAVRVVQRCGRLPLALAIAGARVLLRRYSMGALADRLDREQHRLRELAVDDQDVRASFQVSYRDLDEPGARMFRLLGLLDGPDIRVGVAAALAGVPEERAASLLDQLGAAQLATSAAGAYRMHDLLRLFARERAAEEEPPSARQDAVTRALHCYVGTSVTAMKMLTPSYAWRVEIAPVSLAHPGVELSTVEDVNVWIETERENLVAAAEQAVDVEPALAVTLVAALDIPFEYRGRWRDQLVLSETALRAAERTENTLHLGLACNDVGWALSTLGRQEQAMTFFERALRMWRTAGHAKGEALSTHGLGIALRSTGRYEEAMRVLDGAGALAREVGAHGREATCLTALGLTYQHLGRLDDAVAAHRHSVELAQESGRWRTATMALGNLAEAHRLAGDARLAAKTFRDALAAGRAGDYAGTYWEAEHLWGLGKALHDLDIGGHESWVAAARILCDLGLIGPDERATVERDPVPDTPAVIARQL